VEYSPTVRGRRLIREIERLRHGNGLSMEAAAQRLGWSTSKLYRLENGRSRIVTGLFICPRVDDQRQR
jgi:transcriptional regulator with XRE-family HTH domain